MYTQAHTNTPQQGELDTHHMKCILLLLIQVTTSTLWQCYVFSSSYKYQRQHCDVSTHTYTHAPQHAVGHPPRLCVTRCRERTYTYTHTYLNKELETLLVVLDVGGEAAFVAHVARVLRVCVCVWERERERERESERERERECVCVCVL